MLHVSPACGSGALIHGRPVSIILYLNLILAHSNVAAPTLCLTLVRVRPDYARFRRASLTLTPTLSQPILRTIPPKAPFGPCLVVSPPSIVWLPSPIPHVLQLAIALAANIGGQASPISSPQNLIALQAMQPPLDWGRWFLIAIPVSAVSIVLIWLLLLVSYRPSRLPTGDGSLEIKSIRPTRERFTMKQWWVTFVCVATISLWVVEHAIEEWVGDMGVIAIIPIVAFFGSGVLKKVKMRFPLFLVRLRADIFPFPRRMILSNFCGRSFSLQWVASR